MRRRKTEKHNTRIAVFFILFVFFVILSSFALKAVHIIGQSKFDGSSRFTIIVSNNKALKIFSFSPNTNSISLLNIDGEAKNLNINRFLAIPIDGFIKADFLDTNKDVANLMSNTILSFGNVKTDLSMVDVLRLFLASKTVPSKNVASLDLSLGAESVALDKIISSLFNDSRIKRGDHAIEIVNATSVTGLGARLARLITNMGGKVIQISTDSSLRKSSIILYNGKKTYTVEKLGKVLGFESVQRDRQSIGDITIILGEDSRNPESF